MVRVIRPHATALIRRYPPTGARAILRSMHAMTLASAVVLAPALALLLGFVFVNATRVKSSANAAPRKIALFATALALGMAARLWDISRSSVLSFTVASPPGPAPETLAVHVDVPAGVCLVALLLAGIACIGRDGTDQSRFSRATMLLALAGAVALFLSASIAAFTILWVGLLFLGAAGVIAHRGLDDAVSLLSLAACGAPVLVVSGAALASTGGGSSMSFPMPPPVAQWAALAIIMVGAASAGLTPLNGWIHQDSYPDVTSVVVDLALPLAGVYLAVRGMQLAGPERPIGVLIALIGFGLWGAGDAAHDAFTAGSVKAQCRAAGRCESGLAFVALAIGSQSSVAAALFLTVFSVLARTGARVDGRGWLARLSWASTIGLPPLPGFAGRWLVIAAACLVGQWPLAVAIGCASLLLDLGVFANRGVSAGTDRPTNSFALLPLGALAVAGVVPARWLIAELLPVSALPGVSSPPLSWTISVLALVIALAPLLIAPVAVKPRSAPSRPDISRTIQERGWDMFERFAEGVAGLGRIVEGRYNLAAAFVVIVVAIFGFVR